MSQNIMFFLDTVFLAALVCALLWLLTRKHSRQLCLPPGPISLPIVGNLLQLDKRAPYKTVLKSLPVTILSSSHSTENIMNVEIQAMWGTKLSESYGPVITVHMGLQRAVFLVGYDAVKEALVDQADDFTGRGPLPFFLKITKGYGLMISNGQRWRELRRFTLTTLRDFGMGRKEMEQWIQEESTHLVERIKTTKGEPFDPTYFLSCSVSNVICCLVFGQRFSYDDKHFLHLLQIISQTLISISSPWAMLYNIFPWLMEWLPGGHHKAFARIDELRKFVTEKVREHENTLDPSSPRDYIDCFLTKAMKEKDIPSEYNYDNLVSTVFNLYLGGTESTSSTIRFALNILIKYPGIQKQMQHEIDTVIGQERLPFMEDRQSLPFVDAVIHEVQRFMDIVPLGAPHYALHNITFRGYTIPKGTIIFPMLHSVLKEEKHWATPLSFNPQHFLDHNGNFRNNKAFIPFAAGKRACVGESLARMELFLFLVSLLQHFTFYCLEGPDSIDLSPEHSSFANVPRRYSIIATPR